MSSPDVSLLGVYHHDALDRLVSIVPAGQEVVRRFYLNNRLTTAIQGASRHSVVQAEDLLLALRRVESDQVLFDVLATDQANSVLHSLEAMQSQAFVYSLMVRDPHKLLHLASLVLPGRRLIHSLAIICWGTGFARSIRR